jgi:NTP pyrophosphatase (non-canonical NTP hydrolase)
MPRELKISAKLIAEALEENGLDPGVDIQTITLMEEVGEFAGAYRRATGRARRTDTMEHAYEELADVVIVAYVIANALEIDLDQEIQKKLDTVFSRGWRENVNAS